MTIPQDAPILYTSEGNVRASELDNAGAPVVGWSFGREADGSVSSITCTLEWSKDGRNVKREQHVFITGAQAQSEAEHLA